mmetsp:Transcript_82748/g.210530  ORF Transcript_82748/g.210530 Transcript_82748/m.210530 type:complete len:403 (-) Transcript_82748:98-1306(-)
MEPALSAACNLAFAPSASLPTRLERSAVGKPAAWPSSQAAWTSERPAAPPWAAITTARAPSAAAADAAATSASGMPASRAFWAASRSAHQSWRAFAAVTAARAAAFAFTACTRPWASARPSAKVASELRPRVPARSTATWSRLKLELTRSEALSTVLFTRSTSASRADAARTASDASSELSAKFMASNLTCKSFEALASDNFFRIWSLRAFTATATSAAGTPPAVASSMAVMRLPNSLPAIAAASAAAAASRIFVCAAAMDTAEAPARIAPLKASWIAPTSPDASQASSLACAMSFAFARARARSAAPTPRVWPSSARLRMALAPVRASSRFLKACTMLCCTTVLSCATSEASTPSVEVSNASSLRASMSFEAMARASSTLKTVTSGSTASSAATLAANASM